VIAFDIIKLEFETLSRGGGFGTFAVDPPAGPVSGSPFFDPQRAADEIARQNPDLPPPPPTARYLVGGQQAGLLTGPLYTFLKAISAIALARAWSERSGVPHLPLFWVASEDHDVLEVNRVTVGGRRYVHDYAPGIARGRVPQVADISLADAREPLLEFLRESLPETEFTPWLLDLVSQADWRNYAAAFSDLLRVLFRDWELRLIDPIPLRRLTAPVLAEMVEVWPDMARAFDEGSEQLRSRGIDPPLRRPGFFEIVEGRRVAVSMQERGVRLSGGIVSRTEAAEQIRAFPERFSTGAALRPVVQDAVLPVAATLGGPSELTYLRQIEPLYGVIGAVPSRRHPRISATFVEPRIRRALEKEGLGVGAIFRGPDPVETTDPRLLMIEKMGRDLVAEIEHLRPDPPPRWLRSSRDAISTAVTRIVERARQDAEEAAGRSAARREKITVALLPEGRLQERIEGVIGFLNAYGPGFVRAAVEGLDPETRHHLVVFISKERS